MKKKAVSLLVPLIIVLVATLLCHAARAELKLGIEEQDGRFAVLQNGVQLFTYVWEDPAIPRPYFCNVRLPDGTLLTRPHPVDPAINKGNDDHADLHPGIWIAFGDVNGLDFWRNKARVRLTNAPEPRLRRLGIHDILLFEDTFVLEPLTPGAQPIAEGTNRYTVSFHGSAYVITWCLTLRPATETPLVLGDQEEMGLGVRMNTPLTVKFGSGQITNSEGQRNEAETWGQEAAWCSFSAEVESGKHAGITVYSEEPCWWHTRDYGLMVANDFGRKAMTAPKDAAEAPAKTEIPPGKVLNRAYAVCVFGTSGSAPDPQAVFNNMKGSIFTCDIK